MVTKHLPSTPDAQSALTWKSNATIGYYNNMTSIINVVLPAFFVIFVGFLVGKLLKISISPVVELALYVAVPALVLTSLLEQDIILLDAARVWAAAFAVQAGCFAAAVAVFKALRQKHSGLYMAIALMNTVNIPFPIIYLAYGDEGLVVATLFYLPNVIMMYTLGIYVYSGKGGKESIKEVLRQPVVYAAVLGLVFNFLDVPMPELVMNSLGLVAQLAVPIVLITLGYNLSKIRLDSIPTTVLASVLRIGVGLGLGLLMANVLGLEGIARSVVIIISAMPAAAQNSILATRYNNEPELVSSVVFLTTAASLVIIPLLLKFFG